MNELGIAELPPEEKLKAEAASVDSTDAVLAPGTEQPLMAQESANENPIPMGTIGELNKFLQKRAQIEKKGFASASTPETRKPKVDVYALTSEELKTKLREAEGIGPKLAERVATKIEELKEMTEGLEPGQRELLAPFNTAADLMVISYVGMKRANSIAKAFGMEEAVKVEPVDPPYDEALGDDDGGFDAEPDGGWVGFTKEIDTESPAGWDDRSEEADKQFGSLPEYDENGSVKQAPVAIEVAPPESQEKRDPKKTRKEMLRALVDSIGASTATFFDKMDKAAGRALQSSGVGAMESVVNTAVNNMEKPWEYPADGSAETVQQEKSLFKSILEKLPKLNLSEKQKTLLREKIVPVGAALGGVAATALLTISLLTGGYGFQQSQAETVKGSLTVLVEKATLDDASMAQFESSTATPAQAEEPQSAVIPEILRDGGADWQSDAADEIAKDQNTADVIDALDAPVPPVAGPVLAPDAATAYNPPPLGEVGPSIVPNEDTANKAPEQSAESDQAPSEADIADKQEVAQNLVDTFGVQPLSQSSEESTAAETNAQENPDVILNSKWLKQRVPENAQEILAQANADGQTAENVKLFMPTLGEKFQAPIAEAEVAEAVKKDGILYNQRETFINANELSDDAQAWNAWVQAYIRFNPATKWNQIIPEQTRFQEFNSLEELNTPLENGSSGYTLSAENEVKLYKALQNPASVPDEKVRTVLEGMRSSTINATNMTQEQLETVLSYVLGTTTQVETPAN